MQIPQPIERLIRLGADLHIAIYRLTGGRLLGRRSVLVTTIGRKTGRPRTTPLFAVRDGAGYAVIASYGGNDRHPAWYRNMRHTPRVLLEDHGRRVLCRAEDVADDAEYARLWRAAVAIYPTYETYQRLTERRIPIVRLTPSDGPR